MHKGMLYVNKQEHLSVLITEDFKRRLGKLLDYSHKYLPTICKDARMKDLLWNVSNKDLIDFEYNPQDNPHRGKIILQNIDFYATSHFPPCMLQLHRMLRTNHHLKHFGRLQYGLFLKGVGFSLDESLHLWKSEFVKSPDVTSDKFDK